MAKQLHDPNIVVKPPRETIYDILIINDGMTPGDVISQLEKWPTDVKLLASGSTVEDGSFNHLMIPGLYYRGPKLVA